MIFLNGWRLGSGPCYNYCSENDTASDATEQRRLQCCQNQSEFGKWELELPFHDSGFLPSIIIGNNTYKGYLTYDITSYVYNNTRDEELMISQHDGWEMKRSETLIDIPFDGSKDANFDIM